MGSPIGRFVPHDRARGQAWHDRQDNQAPRSSGVNIEFFAPVEYKTDRRATIAIGVDKIDARGPRSPICSLSG